MCLKVLNLTTIMTDFILCVSLHIYINVCIVHYGHMQCGSSCATGEVHTQPIKPEQRRKYATFKKSGMKSRVSSASGVISAGDADSYIDCARKCVDDVSCAALNYKKTGYDNEANCRLFTYSENAELQEDENWEYFEVEALDMYGANN